MSARRRSRSALSPPISTLFVRVSATRLVVTGAPSAVGACARVVTTRTTSAADACSRGMTSISSSPAWSMRWMMLIMRSTLEARSEMISMFEPGCATRWPYCGTSGRRIGTSCVAPMLRTWIICVIRSSGPSDCAGVDRPGILARRCIRDDLGDVAGRHGGQLVHVEYRQECLVKGIRGHGGRRQHRHLGALYPRVDDECPACDLANSLDDLPDVGFLVIRRDGGLAIFLRIAHRVRRTRRGTGRGQYLILPRRSECCAFINAFLRLRRVGRCAGRWFQECRRARRSPRPASPCPATEKSAWPASDRSETAPSMSLIRSPGLRPSAVNWSRLRPG